MKYMKYFIAPPFEIEHPDETWASRMRFHAASERKYNGLVIRWCRFRVCTVTCMPWGWKCVQIDVMSVVATGIVLGAGTVSVELDGEGQRSMSKLSAPR